MYKETFGPRKINWKIAKINDFWDFPLQLMLANYADEPTQDFEVGMRSHLQQETTSPPFPRFISSIS